MYEQYIKDYGHLVFAKWQPEAKRAIYIGRGSHFGNPFYLADPSDSAMRLEVVKKYKEWLWERIKAIPSFREEVRQLHNNPVKCYCSNGTNNIEDGARLCHGHVLLACANWLNTPEGRAYRWS